MQPCTNSTTSSVGRPAQRLKKSFQRQKSVAKYFRRRSSNWNKPSNSRIKQMMAPIWNSSRRTTNLRRNKSTFWKRRRRITLSTQKRKNGWKRLMKKFLCPIATCGQSLQTSKLNWTPRMTRSKWKTVLLRLRRKKQPRVLQVRLPCRKCVRSCNRQLTTVRQATQMTLRLLMNPWLAHRLRSKPFKARHSWLLTRPRKIIPIWLSS